VYLSLFLNRFAMMIFDARVGATHLKAAGAPRHPSFFCLPKRKKAKKRAPC
jgi:hypothetical protein